MDRLERLKRIERIDATMPSEVDGAPDDQEIAILDELVRMKLTPVQETK
jgi:hypothetical protein